MRHCARGSAACFEVRHPDAVFDARSLYVFIAVKPDTATFFAWRPDGRGGRSTAVPRRLPLTGDNDPRPDVRLQLPHRRATANDVLPSRSNCAEHLRERAPRGSGFDLQIDFFRIRFLVAGNGNQVVEKRLKEPTGSLDRARPTLYPISGCLPVLAGLPRKSLRTFGPKTTNSHERKSPVGGGRATARWTRNLRNPA